MRLPVTLVLAAALAVLACLLFWEIETSPRLSADAASVDPLEDSDTVGPPLPPGRHATAANRSSFPAVDRPPETAAALDAAAWGEVRFIEAASTRPVANEEWIFRSDETVRTLRSDAQGVVELPVGSWRIEDPRSSYATSSASIAVTTGSRALV